MTYMVNCILSGNSSIDEGGGIFNSKHTGSEVATLNLHNCLIAGNIASSATTSLDIGGGVFNGLGSDEAVMEMIHCTVVGNFAGQSYGGVVSVSDDEDCRLYFYNSISRDNADGDGGTDAFKEDLLHVANYVDGDVDNFVAEGSLPAIYDDSPEWTASDPAFVDNGSGSISWTVAAYDPTTGKTTFTTSNTSGAAVNELFKPSTSDTKMLVIESVVANTSVTCWGHWADGTGTAKLYDLQIVDSGSAYDFGGSDHVPDDFCDLNGQNGTTDELPFDLYINGRVSNAAPDCGVHEVAVSSFGGGG